MKRAFLLAAVLFDLLVVIDLGGSVMAAGVFLAFVGLFLLPACLLVYRLPWFRHLPADCRMIASGVVVVILAVPWFFIRRTLAIAPAITDLIACLILLAAVAKFGDLRATILEIRPFLSRCRVLVIVVLPALFALAWLGYGVSSGTQVWFQGLFAIDFGNLVGVVSTLRASPTLPLTSLSGGGPLNYHWLYLTLPATLADFFGASIPAFNALILMNLLMAAFLVHTLTTIVAFFYPAASRRVWQLTVAVVLFAPFSVYYYQTIAARFALGWLAMPARNHLLLSPVNSMIVFGNNTFALVLALLTAMEVELWNRERRVVHLLLGVVALSMVIGYSVTLLFPLVLASLFWLALRRIARPLVVLVCALVIGGAAVAMFMGMHVLGSGGERHVAFALDSGQFLRITIIGMLPLWSLFVLSGRRPLTFFHVLIVVAIAVPTCLFIAGSSTGQIDFSMKTGSLMAVAFAPLIAVTIERWLDGGLRRWQVITAALLVALGTIQTAAYIFQFPYYRLRGSMSRGVSVSADYYNALLWLRDHTATNAIVADEGTLDVRIALSTTWIAERRVWLPTPYSEQFVDPANDSLVPRRHALWTEFLRDPQHAPASGAIARESDYLVVRREIQSPFWLPVSRFGPWMIYRSTARGGSSQAV
jgi:hypothetical protein